MKKIALIVLLAVIASRVLSERDRHPDRASASHRPFLAVNLTDDEQPPRPPMPPLPPEPPQDDHSIRSIPWHGGDRARGDEPTPPKARGKRSVARGGTQPAASTPKEAPAWFPRSEQQEEKLAQPDESGFRVLLGRLSASEERARLDLRKIVNREVADWLAADVPTDWTPPTHLVDRMVWASRVQPVTWSLGAKTGAVDGDAKGLDGSTTPELDSLYTLYRAGENRKNPPWRIA